MNIRPYSNADKSQIIDLWTRVFGTGRPHNDPEYSLNLKMMQEDGLLFIAEEDGNILGTVMGGFDGHRGWIYSLCVSEDKRGKGLGRSLLETMISELKNRGCPKVNLQVVGSNDKVIGFYEKMGFAVEDRISMGKVL